MKRLFCINKHRILSISIISFVTGLIFSGFSVGASEKSSLVLSFFRFFHFANDVKTATPMILTAVPYLVLLCSLTGVFTDDLTIQATYCFCRKKNVFNWYASRIFLLLLFSFLCVTVFFTTGSMVILIFSNNRITDLLFDFSVWKMLVLISLFVFGFSFLINVFSLIVKKKYLFPVTALILFAFSGIIPYSVISENRALLLINPMVHINGELHCNIYKSAFLEAIGDTDLSYLGISFLGSCIYYITVGLISFLLGAVFVYCTDIALKEED